MSDERHIYIGMGKKVWCGAKLRRSRDGFVIGATPITEGDFKDGRGIGLCPECAERCAAVCGEPQPQEVEQ